MVAAMAEAVSTLISSRLVICMEGENEILVRLLKLSLYNCVPAVALPTERQQTHHYRSTSLTLLSPCVTVDPHGKFPQFLGQYGSTGQDRHFSTSYLSV